MGICKTMIESTTLKTMIESTTLYTVCFLPIVLGFLGYPLFMLGMISFEVCQGLWLIGSFMGLLIWVNS